MSLGLIKSVRGYTVPASASAVLGSSTSINPNNITCYNWDGTDSAGRTAPTNSVATRTAGCNSALDSIMPELATRPGYVQMLIGGGSGIQGNVTSGSNQISSSMSLAASNPMALPGLEQKREHYMPGSIFGLGMPVKVIPGQQPAVEHFGSWGSSVGGSIRPSANEHFTAANSYTLADRIKASESFTANSYTLADRMKASESFEASPYKAVFSQAGDFKLNEPFTRVPYALMLSKGDKIEPYMSNLYKPREQFTMRNEYFADQNMSKLEASRAQGAFNGVM